MVNKKEEINVFHIFFLIFLFYILFFTKIFQPKYFFILIIVFITSYLISFIKISLKSYYIKIIKLFLIPLIATIYFLILKISPQTKIFNSLHREIFYSSLYFIFLLFILSYIKVFLQKELFNKKKDFFLFFFLFIIINILLSSFLIIDEFNPYNPLSLNLGASISSVVRGINGEGANIDFINLYGGYANFLTPILKATFNEPKILHITFFFAVIFFFLNLSVFILITKITKDYFLGFFGTIALLYYYLFILNTWPGELYFANAPIRYFAPVLTIIFFYLNLKKINIFNTCFLSFFLFPFIFWNFETGIIGYLSFVFCSLIIFYYQNKKILKSFIFLILIILTASISFGIIQYISYLVYGNFIKLSYVIHYPIERNSGAWKIIYEIKELVNFSIIFIVINIANLYISLKNIRENSRNFINSFIFAISILNFGLMFYYFPGAQHPQRFFVCSYVTILIIIINIHQIREKLYKTNDFFYKQILFCKYLIIFFLSISFFINALFSNTFIQKINLFDILYPDLSKKNSYFFFSFENNQRSQNFIRYMDMAKDSQNLPPWTKKKKIIEKEIKILSLDNKKSLNALILSHNDHYFNSHLNILSNYHHTNYAHEEDKNMRILSLVKNNFYEFVIVDYEYLHPFPLLPIDTIITYLELNYDEKKLLIKSTSSETGNDRVSIFFPKKLSN